MPDRVEFLTEDGIKLVGDVYRPAGTDKSRPGIVLTGPLTGVKEQVVGTYAARLAAEGFVTLAFDHRGFGESDGRRHHEDPAGKLADLRAAVGVLTERTDVAAKSVGLLGVCLGGGYAVRAAAFDPRVKAVAGVAGHYHHPASFAAGMGLAEYRSAVTGLLTTRPTDKMVAVSPDGPAVMGGAELFEYFESPKWATSFWMNEVTVASLYSLMTFDALSAVDLLGHTPLLIVHGTVDAYCSPENARAVYERATGPKMINWLETASHIDLYDAEPYVTQAVSSLNEFFSTRLG